MFQELLRLPRTVWLIGLIGLISLVNDAVVLCVENGRMRIRGFEIRDDVHVGQTWDVKRWALYLDLETIEMLPDSFIW